MVKTAKKDVTAKMEDLAITFLVKLLIAIMIKIS